MAPDPKHGALIASCRHHTNVQYRKKSVLRIRIRIHRIHVFLGLLDSYLDPEPSIIKQKFCKKNLDFYCFVTSF